MKKAVELGILNFVSITLVVLNFRYIAAGFYGASVATDLVIAVLAFTLFKRLQAAETRLDLACYAAAAGLASVAGIWLSKVPLPAWLF